MEHHGSKPMASLSAILKSELRCDPVGIESVPIRHSLMARGAPLRLDHEEQSLLAHRLRQLF